MHIFISHSRQNAGAALKLCDHLTALGARTWLDLRELESGSDWNPRVAEAIRTADGFVFLVGPPGPPDQWQRFEWQQVTEQEFYLDPDKPLVPIVIEGAELPGFLRTRHALYVNAEGTDFDLLARDVRAALDNPGKTVDAEKLERGREARRQSLETLREYSRDLQRADVKRAGSKGL
jgi:hypothetical protein